MDGSSPTIVRLTEQVAKLTDEVKRLRTAFEHERNDNRLLRESLERAQEENRRLRELLEQAQREAARQAAPFRRRDDKKKDDGDKKPPGRKPGHPGHHRPVPDRVDEEHEVPLDRCPECGGEIDDVRPIEQYIEEIPPVRPRVYRIVTYEAHCPRCGEVRSTHPLQTSRGRGAAKVQLGPRALAVAAALNKVCGLTMRTTCRVLKDLLGLSLSPGGLSHAMDRIADRLCGRYEQLLEDIRGSPAVHADETSWYVGEPGWWLWTFTTPQTTVYRVDGSRGSQVVADVLGDEFAGMLVSDCLSSYDPSDYRKHKCIAHHLRAIAKAEEVPTQQDPSYLSQWKLLLKSVIVIHRLAVEGTLRPDDVADKRAALQRWADALLEMPRTQLGDVAVQNRLKKQRAHLLGCLEELAAEPTNNRAERSLRPAVIARKLSCGNKTDRGRTTWQVLASLGATCRQRGTDFIQHVAHHVRLQQLPG